MKHDYYDDPSEVARMNGTPQKVYLITGATSGIGEATATQLAAAGHRILIGARTADRAEPALARIRARISNTTLETVTGDLAEMRDVRTLADQVFERADRLDGLILNAAVSRPRHELTADGFEVNFATNYLSGFLLTNLLMSRLLASDYGRVIALSSSRHTQITKLDPDLLGSGAGIAPSKRYETTKLLNILFVTELARRLYGTSVTANAADPGFVHTNLGRDATGAFALLLKLTRPIQASPEKAARTVVHLATSPDIATTGGYFTNCTPGKTSILSQDPILAKQVWDRTAHLLNAKGLLASAETM